MSANDQSRRIVVGIDASRNRSGGAKAHLIGILSQGNPSLHGISEIHLWTYRSLLEAIPDQPWLIKHYTDALEGSLFGQMWWQATKLAKEAANAGCNILFTTDASTTCRFKPMVVVSQDMLSYEPKVMKSFGYTKDWLRLLAIFFLQNRAMRYASGVIFLTPYASRVIQNYCGRLSNITHIPHGVGEDFKKVRLTRPWPTSKERPISCLYVSPTWLFKHQWVVVRAVASLRKKGYKINLTLVGGGSGKAQKLLEKELAHSDPERSFVTQMDFVPQEKLPALLSQTDLFVFASSCENMPITLIEGMAAGLPIACSDRGPMPEVLENGGIFFDPEDSNSIASAMEKIINDPILRVDIMKRAKNLSEQYSWSRCADQTWEFISQTYLKTMSTSGQLTSETCVES